MSKYKATTPEFLLNLDRLPGHEKFIEKAAKAFATLAEYYGYEKISTAILDDYKTFLPLIKEGYLEKRMPVICKSLKTGEDILLRPSYVLSILRAYGSHKMGDFPHPMKFYATGDSFYLASHKHDSSGAKGGAGISMENVAEGVMATVGEDGPVAEAQIAQLMWKALEEAGQDMKRAMIRVNATGCSSCKSAFRSSYMYYIRNRISRLCKNCKRNIKKYPTKILSCEEEKCRMIAKGAPQVLDFLCDVCKKHLRGFLEFLDEIGVPYILEPKMFKEGFWVEKLVFELTWEREAGSDGKAPVGVVFAEGGRIGRAGEILMGRKVGVACGVMFLDEIERVYLREKSSGSGSEKTTVFVAQLGELAKRKSLPLLEMLRANNIEVKESLGRDSIKSQLKLAERDKINLVLVLGQKEALDGTVIVREIESGIQETIPQEKLIDFIKRKFEKAI